MKIGDVIKAEIWSRHIEEGAAGFLRLSIVDENGDFVYDEAKGENVFEPGVPNYYNTEQWNKAQLTYVVPNTLATDELYVKIGASVTDNRVETWFDDLVITINGNEVLTYYEPQINSTQEYYPFGSIMPGRNFSSNEYRYGFQGQEKDDEIKGSGNSVNYKYRMHDPRLGRFFAVDPLASSYPWNSPYAFSENRLLDAIELEGLEAFFIHGTNHDKDAWGEGNVPGLKSALMQHTNNNIMDVGFSWKSDANGNRLNNLLNTYDDRAIAAEMLASYVLNNRVDGESITLIGYSHGGNVAIQAARILNELDPSITVDLITLNTPVEPAKSSFFNISSITDNNENPNTKGINRHTHFYTKGDVVAGGLSGGDSYIFGNDGKTKNIMLLDRDFDRDDVWYDPFDPHYLENVDPQQIENAVEN